MASITDGNSLFLNQGLNPLVNFNFMLRVELAFDLPCKSVRAFSRELEYEFIQEGGLNDYVHMRRKPITKPFTLEVERYVGVDYVDPLPLGADLVLPIMLFVSRVPRMFIPGVVARTYVFTGCTVMKKDYGELVGDQSGLLVETTTIGYREMMCVDIPWSEVGDNIFASTPTSPTNAATEDKDALSLKAQGQSFYDQALEAMTRSDEEFDVADAEELIVQLSDSLAQLRQAITGRLTQRREAAQGVLDGKDGKDLHQQADEARQEAREKETAARGAERTWEEKKRLYQLAQSEADEAQGRVSELEKRLEELNAQLTHDKETQAALQEKIPADLREVSAAEAARDQAQSTLDEARDTWNKAQRAYEEVRQEQRKQQELAIAKRESAENALANQEEKTRAAREETARAEEIYSEAAAKLASEQETYQSAEEQLAQAEEDAAETAQQALDQAREARDQAQEEADQAQAKLNEARDAQRAAEEALAASQKELAGADADVTATEREGAESSELEARQTELTAAEAAHSAARAELDRLDGVVRDSERLEELNAGCQDLEDKIKETDSEKTAAGGVLSTALQAADAAKKESETAEADHRKAAEEHESADARAKAAQESAAAAEKELDDAKADFNKANQKVNPLQNSLSNLENRKDRTAEAQTGCTEQHDLCKSANDELQGLPDDPVSAVNTAFEKVKKLSKQTVFHERQVRETQQHMQAARELLAEVEPLLENENV